jgi:hypothetical protein
MLPIMADPPIDYVAIGVTFSSAAVRELSELLYETHRFSAEGTGASGYELYAMRSNASEVIQIIQSSEVMTRFKIEIYERIRERDGRTRYDRLLDHLEGEDPNRPSHSGIKFNL